ncbi:MAG: sulfatase-like hydrolase/transferase, partial [Planctomycetota bacterium]|nr:sulfatase-like hydrolase/transferase [Planctomycetota bacterium]
IRKFVDAIANSSWIGAAFAPSKLLKALDKPLFRAYRTHKNKAERGRAARTNKHALGFVDQLIEQPRPYFFFLHYLDPHDPYGTVAPYDMLLEQGRSSMAPVEVDPNHGVMGDTAIMVEKMLQSNDAQQREDAKPMIDFMVRRYIEEMLFTDEAIGEVLSKIEDSGRETIVILTSDHGEHFGEHDLMKHGNSLYQENLRVPFFMYGPGIPEGLRTDQQIQLLDIAPTLYDLCDIDSDANLRGVNIVDLAQSNEIIEREHIAIDGNFFSIRIGNKKYIARWDDRLGLVLGDGLGYFDLDADGNEMKASDDIPAKFRDAIDEALDRDTYQVDAIKSGFQADMGHQLGYTGE